MYSAHQIKKEIYKPTSSLSFFDYAKEHLEALQAEKTGLNQQEIKALETIENLSSVERHSLNIWLYSFYFAGMRISDVLFTRWSQIYDGRLHYRMGKNKKLLSLKIPSKAAKILEEYVAVRFHDDDFIFPEMRKANLSDAKDVYNKIKTAARKINGNLKQIALKAGIRKKITMHIARHSFGNIAGDAIHPLMLQKLYRHSDLKTTLNYQANFIHKEADTALDSVINF
ncbi:tyrosine-type recombinase/integrase [Galbibacter sp. EGI 63066]|uniref:tyrosine-type recombinase/integrase n=1 Tax=Galbibacter sp. EGI 63066 TaxID=2993559 RepID=UPI002B05683C|nr:tyrosine-type recombinase/integrase [Galbibacter sp. EGI 63066]